MYVYSLVVGGVLNTMYISWLCVDDECAGCRCVSGVCGVYRRVWFVSLLFRYKYTKRLEFNSINPFCWQYIGTLKWRIFRRLLMLLPKNTPFELKICLIFIAFTLSSKTLAPIVLIWEMSREFKIILSMRFVAVLYYIVWQKKLCKLHQLFHINWILTEN